MPQPDETNPFDPAFERERQRLAAIEASYDPGTFLHLSAIGVKPGWRCLEVGAGGGSVAGWLARQIAPSGNVVATDIDTRFMQSLDIPNLDVRQHNIVTEDLADSDFDLIHMRLLLDFMPDQGATVRKLLHALRPGGWLVLEEFDLVTSLPDPSIGDEIVERFLVVQSALSQLWSERGYDPACGRRLVGLLRQHGVADVTAEGRLFVRTGGSAGSRAWSLSVEQLRTQLVATGIVNDQDIDLHITDLNNPELNYLSPLMITARGRRPD